MLEPFVETQGEGADLVLLHGWGMHGEIFAGILPFLTPYFRVHSIDLPGFGRSPVANRDYDLNYLVEQVMQVAPPKSAWLGWSLGGMVAMAIASRFPEAVTRLVTVGASAKFIQDDTWQHAMTPDVLDSFARFLKEDFHGTVIRFLAIQTLGSETQKDDLALLKQLVFRHGEPAPRALIGGLDILQKADLRAEIKQIQCPWLRVYGRLDGLVPIKNDQNMQSLAPQSESLVFAKASHAPFISHRDQFVEKIGHFLNSSSR